MEFYEFIFSGIVGKNFNIFTLFFTILFIMIESYLMGGLNFAIILSKKKYNDDIRDYGSGNAGMTNMLRTYGKGAAGLTLAGDALKTVIAVSIGVTLFGYIGGYVAGIFCLLGHAFPWKYKFKGGKGVVVTAVTLLMLDWQIFLILLIVFTLVVWFTKFISLGSLTAMFLLPILLSRLNNIRLAPYDHRPYFCIILSMIMAGLVVFLHRENIKRIYRGEESKLSFKTFHKKKKDQTTGDSDEQ